MVTNVTIEDFWLIAMLAAFCMAYGIPWYAAPFIAVVFWLAVPR